jgi:alkaline phosphatase D
MRQNQRLILLCLSLMIAGFNWAVSAQKNPALAGASRPKPQMQLKDPNGQYKRIHQYALRLILLLRFDESKAFILDHLSEHPDDAESHYLMGIWHARQSNANQAEDWFNKAINLGLPKGRVIAGPRALYRGIDQNHPFLRDLGMEEQNQLVHGPLVGHVSHAAASFWFRSSHSSTIKVIASTSPRFSPPLLTAIGQTHSSADYTGIVRLIGLNPSTTYFYRIEIDGKAISIPDGPASFRTFALPGASSRFRLAFGGGSGFVPRNERAWTTIEAFSPQVLLLFGDNVYIDDPESIIMQRYTYHRRQSRPEWRHLTARTPVFTIWDDHDFGTNDSWGGPHIDEPFWKPHFAFRTFRENWANPGYGGGNKQPGCWYTFQVGDVDFVMLDCRYYRTNPKGNRPTMLGPVQMKWFEETLIGLKGTFKVICSSVPWDFRTKGDSLDTWNGYKDEREHIFSFLEEQKIEGVLLMSADRHRSDAWRIDRAEGYSFYEFNSSRLTNQHVHREMTDAGALFSYNKKQSFGLVDFNTTQSDPTATYSVVSIDGEIVHETKVRRSMLNYE